MTYVLWGLLGLFVCFFAVLVIRALCFQPRKQSAPDTEAVSFDHDTAVSALQQLVQCKTVSCNDPSAEDDAEFEKLVNLLPALYPDFFAACPLLQLPDRALLFKWTGKQGDRPAVMMSHYDVVSATEELWEKPPFSGIIEDGFLWGRGTLDTKVTMNAALSAANALIRDGFVPEQDVYFAFSGNEEINGKGAVNIVNYFTENGITPALVLDEGGAVVENIFPGVKEPCAMIGIAEKGMMNVRCTVRSQGGHASAPLPNSPIDTLAKACRRIVEHPFKMKVSPAAGQMFDTLARRSTFVYKLIFANLWCFRPVLNLICRKSGGEMNALVRTTTAFTQARGSDARNVIPTEASLVCNMRLAPGDSVERAASYLRKTVKDPDVEISVLEGQEPSPISETDCDSWNKVAAAVAATWNGCVVTPYLMIQCSDSRHYRDISRHIYKFSAMDLSAEERRTIHGNNEKIRLETVIRSVEFYIRLLKSC